ncbi:MAG: sulfite exporter TauE/SafE family protein [Pseudobdellovibrionaceae bacterium]
MELSEFTFLIITFLFFMIAAIYSSVGHAGASGYTVVLTLFGASPAFFRPVSLILNIAVGLIGLIRFHRAGFINYKKVFPFVITSMPLSFLAAQINVDKRIFFLLLGLLLLFSGLRFLLSKKATKFDDAKINNASEELISSFSLSPIPRYQALLSGALIGFFSGITGTGGAIFFTPLILTAKWVHPKEASGLSTLFVLANSIFGFAGIWKSSQIIPLSSGIPWTFAVALGAFIGTHFGITKFSSLNIKKVLGAVLLLASFKLFVNAF